MARYGDVGAPDLPPGAAPPEKKEQPAMTPAKGQDPFVDPESGAVQPAAEPPAKEEKP
jgi:hypothetical protein